MTCRRDVKDSDFARIMPKLVAHLQAVDYGPPDADPRAPPPADFLPQPVLDEHDLMPWLDALAVVHAKLGTPLPVGARTRARRRLVFNEAVLLSIMMLHHRVALQSEEHPIEEAPVVCDAQVGVRPTPLLSAPSIILRRPCFALWPQSVMLLNLPDCEPTPMRHRPRVRSSRGRGCS